MKTWSNAKGDGKLFTFELLDESGGKAQSIQEYATNRSQVRSAPPPSTRRQTSFTPCLKLARSSASRADRSSRPMPNSPATSKTPTKSRSTTQARLLWMMWLPLRCPPSSTTLWPCLRSKPWILRRRLTLPVWDFLLFISPSSSMFAAVITEIGLVTSITTKKDQSQLAKRDVTLVCEMIFPA